MVETKQKRTEGARATVECFRAGTKKGKGAKNSKKKRLDEVDKSQGRKGGTPQRGGENKGGGDDLSKDAETLSRISIGVEKSRRVPQVSKRDVEL